MNGCFSFRFQQQTDSRKSLVLFFSGEVSSDVAAKVIKADVEQNLVPAYVYVLASEVFRQSLDQIVTDRAFNEEVESFVGEPERKLRCLYFSNAGEIFVNNGSSLIPASLSKEILGAGVIDIFQRRCGVITSQSNYHFLKPSGDHCNAFIRASNLLASSVEVSFLSIGLLPLFIPGLKRIYVDTSSIYYLIGQALTMSGRFGVTQPLIESFESYAVFNKIMIS